ncbi:MAG TPA: HAD-IA family hydrolase [Rhizobacter sp.]|nr:HAD-IA family hydrolase [Rhizobacter sp.]
MRNDISALFFDLDGTLVDSAAGVAFALNAALAEAALPRFEPATVRGWIGDGPDALILRALQACGLRDAELPPLAARLREHFDAVTLSTPAAQGQAFDGMAALLSQIGEHYPMAVVTNKPTPLARAVLQGAGLLHHFAQVHGADLPAQRKPSPLLIQQAAQRLGVRPDSVLLVGDGPADIKAAHAAGCQMAWADWGYGPVPSVLLDNAWRLSAPAELLALRPREIH